MRLGIVPNCTPLISSMAARGNPKGSQVLKLASLVPAGLYFPMGLLALKSFWPSGVKDGTSGWGRPGTPAPDWGPDHVPVNSWTGAGPPVPTARLRPLYFHGQCSPVSC